MSQEVVFSILKKLGGKATTKEITDYARKNYQNYGFIKRAVVNKGDVWEILKEYTG